MMHPIRTELFGGLRLCLGNQVVTRFRTHKTGELLAYLAYFRERVHPREILIDLLWPDDDIDAGRHSLSTALSSLRGLLEPAGSVPDGTVLRTDRYTVGLNRETATT